MSRSLHTVVRSLSFLLCLAFVPYARGAQQPEPGRDGLQRSPRPEWVEPQAAPGPGEELGGPVEYLLIDVQENRASDPVETFVHVVKRVRNEQGVRVGSELRIDFDPAHEQLLLHTVEVQREGVTLERLDLERFQVLQQEPGLDQQLLDGRRTALLFLEDVRVGDLIELAYIRRGAPPIFEGRLFTSFSTASSVPVRALRQRLLWPTDRALFVRAHGIDLEPLERQVEGLRDLTWSLDDVPARTVDSDLPRDHAPYSWVQVSELGDWSEVADWARPLFALPAELGPELRALAEELGARSADPRERLRLALRWVQTEVRYLGLELGSDSYRPTPPDEVLRRRFGDCKDKAVLLAVLARELGVSAEPALVNTSLRGTLARWLPAPTAFDHVIVRAEIGDEELWVDPTRDSERGPLCEASLPDYALALPVGPDAKGLVAVVRDLGESPRTTIRKTFQVAEEGPTTLEVESVFSGGDANQMRAYLDWVGLEDLAEGYLNYAARQYPSIEPLGTPEVFDDAHTNRISVRESYRIPMFWAGRTDENGTWAAFRAAEIDDEILVPSDVQRRDPIGIPHPRYVTYQTVVHLPGEWQVRPETVRVQNSAVSFQRTVAYTPRRLELSYHYRSLADRLPASESAAYLADVERMRDTLGYEISNGMPAGGSALAGLDPEGLLELVVGAVLIALAILVAVGVLIYRSLRRPAASSAEESFELLVGGQAQAAEPRIWRQGRAVVLEHDAQLPERCLRCNEAASAKLKRKLSWHSPWFYFLILAGVIVYAIVALVVRKQAQVTVGLCARHHRRRRATILGAWALALVGIVGCIAGPADSGAPLLFGFAAGLVALVLGARLTSLVRPVRIDDRRIELVGAGKPFLEALPRRAA